MSLEAIKYYIEFALVAFTSIFFIVNPFPTSTIFVSLCEGMSRQERKAVARRAAVTAFLVLLIFTVMGDLIFKFFNISLPAFRVAGGIIIFGIGYRMLRGKPAPEKHSSEDIDQAMQNEEFALVPLAIPMLAGPGSISTVMVLAGEVGHWLRFPIIIAAIALALFLSYVVLWQAEWIADKVSKVTLKTLSRLMGIMVCVIAVQFTLSGLKDFFIMFCK